MKQEIDISKFVKLIYSTTGIDNKTIGDYSYHSAIEKCMKSSNLTDPLHYLDLVRESREALMQLVDEIIVPETWFFRDENAFDALVQHLNKQIATTRDRPLRILSLPASTGEEAYSVAIKLQQHGFTDTMYSIDAIDISQRNIDHAVKGHYRQHSFRRDIADDIFDRYFKQVDEHFEVCPNLKNSIVFQAGNIFELDTYRTSGYYDVILCRNLFIYFDMDKKKSAYKKINNVLRDGGLLLIGHSETSIISSDHYMPCGLSRSFGFIKSSQPILRKTVNKTRKYWVSDRLKFKKKSRSQPDRNKELTQPVLTDMVNPAEAGNRINLHTARDLADKKQYSEALAILKTIHQKDRTADCFFLEGIIYNAMQLLEQAEKSYRKALFLSPDHQEALLQLAYLMEKKGDKKNYTLLRKRVEKQLNRAK